jgi:cytochrome b561
MSIRNTSERYGAVAVSLHWLVAVLFFASYAAAYLPGFFIEQSRSGPPPGLSIHQAVGVSIFMFAG